jgi:3-methylcrotonyl-CoA carboxylase alpha subunit
MKFIARRDGEDVPVEVERHGSGYVVRIGDRTLNVDYTDAGPFVHSLRFEDGTQFGLTHHSSGTHHEVSLGGVKVQVEIVDPLALRRRSREDAQGEGGDVTAPMPGRIVRVLVEAGQAVRRGEGLMILEAMKMENEIQAPVDGTVSEIYVNAGETVESGAVLVHIG